MCVSHLLEFDDRLVEAQVVQDDVARLGKGAKNICD